MSKDLYFEVGDGNEGCFGWLVLESSGARYWVIGKVSKMNWIIDVFLKAFQLMFLLNLAIKKFVKSNFKCFLKHSNWNTWILLHNIVILSNQLFHFVIWPKKKWKKKYEGLPSQITIQANNFLQISQLLLHKNVSQH